MSARSWGRLLVVVLGLGMAVLSARPIPAGEPGDELAAQVTIRRDKFGVPHILGKTEEAVAFGHGYAQAEDHIQVLGRLFLKARSEEAAYFGEEFAESDFATKLLHMYEGAERGFARLAPWSQGLLDGYARGYNRYVQQHRGELPEWIKPVTGIDVLAHGRRVVLMEFSMDLEQLRHIGQKADAGRLSEAALARGSNMWAIGKSRSASGKTLLLGNPHLEWGGSQIFCEAHLTVPGKLNISGTTLIGSPIITIGFNDNLGWSHTVNLHDSDDVYELTLDPNNPHRYVYDGNSLPLHKEELTVQVKTPTGMVPRKLDVWWSHYGPVMKVIGDKAYAFKSANLDEYRFVEQWYLMGKARNLSEFRHVLDMQAIPMFNICYADKEGNIFYLFNGRFPDRPTGYHWDRVVPGDTSASEWNHLLPQARLPFLVNPAGGYVQNCNSAPWYTNPHAPIDRRAYPTDLTPNFNSMRTQLSLEMLESHPKLSLDDVRRLKYNTKLVLADRVKGDVIKAIRHQSALGIPLDEAADVLERWDNTTARDSKGAMLFATFWKKYGGETKKPYATDWNERKPAATPVGLGDPATARSAMAAAVKEMKQRYNSLEVPWGEIHRLRRGSLDAPIGGFISEYRENFKGGAYGDFGAFRVVDYKEAKDGKYVAFRGDSYVMAVEFTTPPTAYSICAYSQSDDPRSPHHTDQSALFAQEKWKRAWFTEADIAKNLEREYHP